MTFDESESEGSTAICPLCGVDFNDDEEANNGGMPQLPWNE